MMLMIMKKIQQRESCDYFLSEKKGLANSISFYKHEVTARGRGRSL